MTVLKRLILTLSKNQTLKTKSLNNSSIDKKKVLTEIGEVAEAEAILTKCLTVRLIRLLKKEALMNVVEVSLVINVVEKEAVDVVEEVNFSTIKRRKKLTYKLEILLSRIKVTNVELMLQPNWKIILSKMAARVKLELRKVAVVLLLSMVMLMNLKTSIKKSFSSKTVENLAKEMTVIKLKLSTTSKTS